MQRLNRIQQSIKVGGVNQSSQEKVKIAQGILSKGIFSIEAINKSINKRILSMFYSPGVGACCMAIKDNFAKIDELTLRGRSVAIVSDGSMLGCSGKQFLPVMDWFIAQIKFYSLVDCFPFVIRQTANLQTVLEDLSTCYGTVLFLDKNLNQKIKKLPDNILVVEQEKVSKITNTQITDAQQTAYVLASMIKRGTKGIATKQQIQMGLKEKPIIIKKDSAYHEQINDGKDINQHALRIHSYYRGKIEIDLSVNHLSNLKQYFTLQNWKKVVQKDNISCKTKQLSAIVTDGTAILGFGNIGPSAGLPVMEGKSLLFKLLGQVEVVPLCIKPRKSPSETVEGILDLLSFYQAINLEDFAAPQCFQIETRLQQKNIMPVFHDDQHGTAIVVLAAFINSVKLANKDINNCKVVINGAGAAGITIAKILKIHGVKSIVICDREGAIYKGRKENMNSSKNQISEITNPEKHTGKLQKIIENSDVFIGVSAKGALQKDWVKKMNDKPIIFALANPDPEITEKQALQGGCYIYASGRSDFSNQINNSLVFPGIFMSIKKHKLSKITDEMKVQTAQEIASIMQNNLNRVNIIPQSLNKDVALRICSRLQKFK